MVIGARLGKRQEAAGVRQMHAGRRDGEGVVMLDRVPTKAEGVEIRDILGIPKRVEFTEEVLAARAVLDGSGDKAGFIALDASRGRITRRWWRRRMNILDALLGALFALPAPRVPRARGEGDDRDHCDFPLGFRFRSLFRHRAHRRASIRRARSSRHDQGARGGLVSLGAVTRETFNGESPMDGYNLDLGLFDTEEEAALAHDRAFIIMHGDKTLPEDLNFPAEKSEHVTFSPELMRALLAARDGTRTQ